MPGTVCDLHDEAVDHELRICRIEPASQDARVHNDDRLTRSRARLPALNLVHRDVVSVAEMGCHEPGTRHIELSASRAHRLALRVVHPRHELALISRIWTGC